LQLLGSVLGELARYDEAEVAFRGAIGIYGDLHGEGYGQLAESENELGLMLLHKGDLDGAEAALRSSLAGVRKLYGAQSNNAWAVESNLFRVLEMKGQFADVLPQRTEMIDQEKKVLGDSRPDSIAFHTNMLGVDYRELGRFDEAVAAFREALAIWAKIQGANTEANSVNPLANLGITLVLQGDYAQAEAALRGALAIQQKHELPSSQWLNATRGELGNLLRLQHRPAEAVHELREAIAAMTAVAAESGSKPNPFLCALQARLAEAELDAGSPADAHVQAVEALALARLALPSGNYRLGMPLFALARAKLALGKPAEAEPLLHEALTLRSPVHPPADPRVLEVDVTLVNSLAAQGKTEQAKELTAQIRPLLDASKSPYADDLRARLAAH